MALEPEPSREQLLVGFSIIGAAVVFAFLLGLAL